MRITKDHQFILWSSGAVIVVCGFGLRLVWTVAYVFGRSDQPLLPAIFDYWWIIILIGLGLSTLARFLPKLWSMQPPIDPLGDNMTNSNDNTNMLILPVDWNERQIELSLRQSQNRPGLIEHYVNSVLDRYIAGQDQRTAQKRIAFLQAKLQELNATYDVAMAVQKLQGLNLDVQIEVRKKGVTLKELDAQEAELELRRQKAIHEAQNLGKSVSREPVREDYDFEA